MKMKKCFPILVATFSLALAPALHASAKPAAGNSGSKHSQTHNQTVKTNSLSQTQNNKSAKSRLQLQSEQSDIRTDTPADTQTDTQTDIQTDTQTDTQEDTQTDTQTDTQAGTQSPAGSKKHKGIWNALQHVKNPRAQAVLQAILEGRNPSTVAKEVYGSDPSTEPVPDEVTDEMLSSLEQVAEESPAEATEALDTLSQTLEEAGNLEQAIRVSKSSAAINPKDLKILKRLGKLYDKAGDKELKTFVNGKIPLFDQKPFVKEGRTLVPIRAIAEALGATVNWDEKTQALTIVKDGKTVTLKLGSAESTVNGKPVLLDVPAATYGNRTFVPARFVSEALGATVNWIEEGNIVNIVTDDQTVPAEETTNNPAPEQTQPAQ